MVKKKYVDSKSFSQLFLNQGFIPAVGHLSSLMLFSLIDMNIEKVSERNFIYAVNYETIIAALSLSESSAVSLFDTISTHVSIYEPLVVHIKTYQQGVWRPIITSY